MDRNTEVITEHLTKRYGYRNALKDVTMRLYKGQILGLLGPNGAGKSTLLKVLATITAPTSGSVMIGGLDLKEKEVEIRRRIGYLGHEPLLYRDLTGEENVRFYYRFYHNSTKVHIQERIHQVFELLKILRWRHEPIKNLSRGLKKRFDLARAVIHDPDVLLFDEPFSGLDVESLDVARELVASMEGDKAIIIATHDINEAKILCNNAMIMVEGRLTCMLEKEEIDEENVMNSFREGSIH